MPPVSRYMTANPHRIGSHERLDAARSLMLQHAIHHLPVVDDDRLVGIVSDRDLALMGHDDRVREAMTRDVATVASGAGLDEVVNLMEAGNCGSVVITGHGGVEGIFTVTDVVRAFGDLLRRLDDEH